MRTLLPPAVVAVLVLAGCLGGGQGTVGPTTSAAFTAATGGIQGKIVTDEIQPIAGATVALLKTDINTTTAEDGGFAFSNLEPGPYTVVALKLGYHQFAKPVDVAPGQVTNVTILLDKVPVSEPAFDVVLKYGGTLLVGDACDQSEAASQGVTWQDYPIDINETKEDGTPLAATYTVVDLKSVNASGTVDIDMYLYNSQGKEVGRGTGSSANEHFEIPKLLPPDKYRLHVCFWLGAHADYAITARITFEQGESALYAREKASGGK